MNDDDEGSWKPCPKCATPMVDLRSINLRQCVKCGHVEAWLLAKGQRPLINTNRGDRKR